jgi:iron complex outermembrane receptor protein
VATVGFRQNDWSYSLTQLFRSSYVDNFSYPGLVSGVVRPPNLQTRVPAYILYNASVTWRGIEGLRVTGGIRNLFNEDPPFTLNYDSGGGSGSSWEPRVADPRGRSFTLSVEYEF